MMNSGTNPSCEVLYVDDEEKALKYFKMAFSSKFTIHTAPSAKEGLEIIRRLGNQIGIVISDQRMPEMLGAEFLGLVRQEFPHVVRILTTAYSDLESAIQAVNKGHIYQYVVKPWEVKDFGMVLQRAADYHHVLNERNELLALKMSTLQRILSGDRLVWLKLFQQTLSADLKAAFGQALVSFVRALPHPAKFLNESPGAIYFNASSILHGEYENATKAVAALSVENASSRPVEFLNETLAVFSSVLVEKYGFSSERISVSVEGNRVEIRLSNDLEAFKVDPFTQDLFGLLLAKSAGDLSLSFFRLLLAVALVKGVLTLSISGADSASAISLFTFSLEDNLSEKADDAIDVLYERVSAWDVASR